MVLAVRTSSGEGDLPCLSGLPYHPGRWMILRPWVAGFAIPPLAHDPDLLRAWRSHPEHRQYRHQYMGRIRQYSVGLQDYQEASKQYRMALRENPLSSRTWFDSARVHWWLGQVKEARDAWGLRCGSTPAVQDCVGRLPYSRSSSRTTRARLPTCDI